MPKTPISWARTGDAGKTTQSSVGAIHADCLEVAASYLTGLWKQPTAEQGRRSQKARAVIHLLVCEIAFFQAVLDP